MTRELDKRIEEETEDHTIDVECGYFTCHKNKLVCYLDIQGTSNIYNYLSTNKDVKDIEKEVIERYLKNFLSKLNKISDKIYSIHVMSDSALIVPKSRPQGNHSIPTFRQFFKTIFNLYKSLLYNGHACKFIITQGQYFSVGLYKSKLNIYPGGKVLSDCVYAEKNELNGEGPGVFSDLKEFTNNTDENSRWNLINLSSIKYCFSNIEKLKSGLDKAREDHIKKVVDNIGERYNKIKDWLDSSKNGG